MNRVGLLVSVVDDDESIRESLPDLLEELGFAVSVYCSAEEFLESEEVESTSCLICDVSMPGMNGPDLKRELDNRQLRIPVIFITAFRNETARKEMLLTGAVDYLIKPFSDISLMEALDRAVRKR